MGGFKDVGTLTILLDFDNQAWRSYHATSRDGMINSDGLNVGTVIAFSKILMQAINEAKRAKCLPHLVICEDRYPERKHSLYERYQKHLNSYTPDKNWDGKDKSQRIKYKGNRSKSDLDYNPLDMVRQFTDCMSCTKIWRTGEEADDVIASYISNHPKDRIIVYSSDKDLWQLIPKFPNMKIRLGDGTNPTPELITKHFEENSPHKILLHKMIRGDSGDNVKSVYSYPFKKTVQAYLDCNGSFEDYFLKLRTMFGDEHKYVQHLMNYLGVIRLNYHVVKLRTDLKYEVTQIEEANLEKWNKLCYMYETPSLLNSPMIKLFGKI